MVPTVSWVTLDEEPGSGTEPVAATGTESPETLGVPAPSSDGGRPAKEVGLCPDCLAGARARGRLLAPIIPLRPGGRRRRRRSSE